MISKSSNKIDAIVVPDEIETYVSMPSCLLQGCSNDLIIFRADGGNHFTHYGIYEGMFLIFDVSKDFKDGHLSCYLNNSGDDRPKFKVSDKPFKGFNDLKTKYPSLAAEWSEKNLPLTPDAVNEKSTKNVWWKCRTCGYEWKAVVKARVKGGMCPVCAERAVLQGYNDLGTTDPHLLSEWDYEKNSKWTPSNVSRNSMKVVWWKCGAGHSYRAKITDRTIEQKGCPQCEAEFQQALPQMLIMMYGAQNGITVKSNSDSELGMRLVAYLPELHCAVDIAGATVTEKREQSVKAHICQSNRLGYYLIKRTADASQMAAEIKTLFIRNHIYLHTDSEKDVQVLRERFLEWKYRNACKLNGKY